MGIKSHFLNAIPLALKILEHFFESTFHTEEPAWRHEAGAMKDVLWQQSKPLKNLLSDQHI